MTPLQVFERRVTSEIQAAMPGLSRDTVHLCVGIACKALRDPTILPDEFERFWHEQGEWSEKTFGSSKVRGPLGPLQHLEKEAIEAQTEVAEGGEKLHEEIADCLFLTLDAARRSGLTPAKLLTVAFQKLEKNKQREWGPFNPNGPTEHIREKQ